MIIITYMIITIYLIVKMKFKLKQNMMKMKADPVAGPQPCARGTFCHFQVNSPPARLWSLVGEADVLLLVASWLVQRPDFMKKALDSPISRPFK